MVKLTTLAGCFFASLISQSASHFLLLYPPGVGFDDSIENTAPCGGFAVDFSKDNVTDFHVGGDVLALKSIHPQATWLFRATLDQTASGNWTNLLPAVQQTGLNNFCEPALQVPESFAGSKGVLGIVQDAPDGLLYQCAAVNFVAGAATATQSVCSNETGTTASFVADPSLSNLPSAASSTPSNTPGTPTSGSTSSSTAKPSSANAVYGYTGLGMLVWFMVIGSATFLACLL